MFVFSMLQDGPRGMQHLLTPPDERVDDLASYGIDWDVIDDQRLMNHLLRENPQDWEDQNPFSFGPTNQSHVPCEPPDCPLSADQVIWLDDHLAGMVDLNARNMQMRRLVWEKALMLCVSLHQV
jgi:hypothetical protein